MERRHRRLEKVAQENFVVLPFEALKFNNYDMSTDGRYTCAGTKDNSTTTCGLLRVRTAGQNCMNREMKYNSSYYNSRNGMGNTNCGTQVSGRTLRRCNNYDALTYERLYTWKVIEDFLVCPAQKKI